MIKIDELRNELDKLGSKCGRRFKVDEENESHIFLEISRPCGWYIFATFSKTKQYDLQIQGLAFEDLPKEIQESLFELCSKFIITPIPDRGPSEYHYALKSEYCWMIENFYERYLIRDQETNRICLGREDISDDYYSLKNTFTVEEFKKLTEDFKILPYMFEKMEVK